MESSIFVHTAISAAAMVVGFKIGDWHNKRYGENRRMGAYMLAGLFGVWMFGALGLAFQL